MFYYMYIHERDNWTAFKWDASALTVILEKVNRKQGLLYGRLASLGFDSKLKAMAENLTYDIVHSSEIEGIRLNADEVRSSIARKLGIKNVKQTVPSHYVDSVVAVMLDAVSHYDQPLTKDKLCAWQATFALLMKACQKDSSFLDGKVMPRVYDMPHPIAETIAAEGDTRPAEEYLKETLPHYLLGGNTEMVRELTDAILLMNHADTLGSIMKFDIAEPTRNAIFVRTEEYEEQLANGEIVPSAIQLLMPYMRIILALTEKYAALVMNPPYMGSGHFDSVLSKYVKDNYAEGKADLFSVFMLMGMERLAPNGKMAQINMQSWMFLSSFEKLRSSFLTHYNIDSMLHLGHRTFDELSGEVVQNTAFALCKHEPVPQGGVYYRLVDGKNCADKEQLFLSHIHGDEDGNRIYFPNVEQKNFEKIPGVPIGYWVSEKIIEAFGESKLSDIAKPKQGLATGNNPLFLRYLWEISSNKRGRIKWVPCTKGGSYRKWYGNIEYCVNWENDGFEIKNYRDERGKLLSRPQNNSFYFKQIGITWSTIASGKPSFRYFDKKWLFETKGSVCFPKDEDENNLIMGYLNSPLVSTFLQTLAPTLDYHEGPLGRIPCKDISNQNISNIVHQNITLSKQDWDSHETSGDFQGNELLSLVGDVSHVANGSMSHVAATEKLTSGMCGETPHLLNVSLEELMEKYKQKWERKFMQLHANEEELNRQFIDIYGLQDELTPDVPLNEITILQQGEITIE